MSIVIQRLSVFACIFRSYFHLLVIFPAFTVICGYLRHSSSRTFPCLARKIPISSLFETFQRHFSSLHASYLSLHITLHRCVHKLHLMSYCYFINANKKNIGKSNFTNIGWSDSYCQFSSSFSVPPLKSSRLASCP